MIRFLFVVLSVVAAVLAWLMEMIWLYAVAGALLLMAGVLVVVDMRRRYRSERQSYSGSALASPRGIEPASKEELLRHGILEVRARGGSDGPRIGEAAAMAILSEKRGAAESGEEFAPRHALAETSEGIVSPATPVQQAATADESRPRVTPVYSRPAPAALGSHVEAALRPFLTAVQTSLGAYSVCLFRIDHAASRYRLVSIVSRDPQVVPDRSFRFNDYFLSRVLPEPTLLDLPQDTLHVENLGYYREAPAIGQVAIVPLLDGEEVNGFLLADRLTRHGGFSDQACDLLFEAARLLGLMARLPADNHAPVPAASSAASPPDHGPRLRLVEVGRSAPQRDVIAQEMRNARAQEHPLALALVYLYGDVDAFAAAEDRSVEEAEEHVLAQLREMTPNGRVDRFGEMGFGVFHYGEVEEVTEWVKLAHETINARHSPEEGQISIGVAMLSDRHRNPDDLQVDAARALRAAYETGESTILVK